MLTETNYFQGGIAIDMDSQIISHLIKDGLRLLCLCQRGAARSPAVADLFYELGIKSGYIDGGLKGIKKLSETDKESLLRDISKVPNIIIALTDFETVEYTNEINYLNSCRTSPVFISDEISQMGKIFNTLS